MSLFYAMIASGQSYSFANGAGKGFQGLNGFKTIEADTRVDAFLQLYNELSKDNSEITALKTDYQDKMLGFSQDEWDAIEKAGITIKEGYPESSGVQIQAIRDEPF